MPPEPDWPTEDPPGVVMHRFTVNRGMLVAFVIETTDWYWGLLQAASARVRIEGLN